MRVADLRRPKSWTEWLNNFLEDEQAYYRNVDGDEEIDVGHGSMPGGDDVFYDEIDDGILESLVIIVLACALAFLVYYRQFRQANNRRIEEDRRRREEFHAGQAQNGAQAPDIPPAEGQQADGGFFPPPDDPNFAQWVAGGVGH
jgi:SEL1 protein